MKKLAFSFRIPKENLSSLLKSLKEEAEALGLEVREGSYPKFFVKDEEIEECMRKGIDPRTLGAEWLVVIAGDVVISYEDPSVVVKDSVGVIIEVPIGS